MPILFPIDPVEFWKQIRQIIREEIKSLEISRETNKFTTPGLDYKPLYKIKEVYDMFQITKPTVYEWTRAGKLKPFKIRSRVFFLHNDIQKLLSEAQDI